MKKIIIIIAALILTFSFTAIAYSSELSYGIGILRKEVNMTKCSKAGGEVWFNATDFDKALGVKRIGAICIGKLPDRATGALLLGGEAVYSGQVITREEISSLCFMPAGTSELVIEFTFSDAKESSQEYLCTLNLLYEDNAAPVGENVTYTTKSNVELIQTLDCYDPDGDKMCYKLPSGTKRGRIKLLNENTGDFSYIPNGDFLGKDSFTYTVFDSYGNESEPITVSIIVRRNSSGIVYSDMLESKAHNAAILLAESGLMRGESIGGISCFYPEKAMTRAEFLRICMKINGFNSLDKGEVKTVFSDDDDIEPYDKPIVNEAYEDGVVLGKMTQGELCFLPNEPISIGEAINVLARFESKEFARSVFNYEQGYTEAYNILEKIGLNISYDVGNAEQLLTREIAADLLFEYKENKQ